MQAAGAVLAILLAAQASAAGAGPPLDLELAKQRSSPQDLQLSGDLPELAQNGLAPQNGLAQGSVRYVAYADLLRLPQRTFSVTGDANFPQGAKLSGVSLDELIRALGLSASGQLVAAVCDDKYEAHYTAEYRSAHQPVLVLHIEGKPPADWRKIGRGSYGPYLISHASFTPAFHNMDEPQIPYGVVELKFEREAAVLDALRPPGNHPSGAPVMLGYRIAFQNCLRCHNQGVFGGLKSNRDWMTLARYAARDPAGFAAIIRDPRSRDRGATMPGNPEYNAPTLHALTAYFQAFLLRGNPPQVNRVDR